MRHPSPFVVAPATSTPGTSLVAPQLDVRDVHPETPFRAQLRISFTIEGFTIDLKFWLQTFAPLKRGFMWTRCQSRELRSTRPGSTFPRQIPNILVKATSPQGWTKSTIFASRFPGWPRRIRLCQTCNGANPRPGVGPTLRARHPVHAFVVTRATLKPVTPLVTPQPEIPEVNPE